MFLTRTLITRIKLERHMKFSIFSAMALILAVLVSPVTHSEPHANALFSPPYLQFAQNNNQSLNSAVQAIKQQTGGRILSAKTVKKNGQRIYKIKVLLPSGKVQTFKVSAQ